MTNEEKQAYLEQSISLDNNICKHADEVATRIQMRNETLDLLKK